MVREHPIERLSLCERAREAVQDKALRAVRLLDPLGDQAVDHIVGDQPPGIHDRLGLTADFGPGGDRLAQHVAGREMGQPVAGLEAQSLGPLAGPRRAEQHEVHQRLAPRRRAFLISPSY